MKFNLLLLSLFVAPFLSNAQENPLGPAPASYTVPSVWCITFLGIGLSNETRLGPKTTLASGLNFQGNFAARGGALVQGTTGNSVVSSYSVAPVLQTGLRHYYNFERRLEKGKSIRYNSGNYVSGRLRYITGPVWERVDRLAPLTPIDGVYADALWGFQRTYRRNFYLNLSLGVGAGRNGVYPAADFLLGYTFPNRSGN